MRYHYTECGLDYVFIEGGVETHATPYGEGISIADVEGLHRAIGTAIVSRPQPLRGAELRFLRSNMDITQARLADMLGSTEQSVRLWEKSRDKPLGGPVDRLLRMIYMEHTGRRLSVRRVVEVVTRDPVTTAVDLRTNGRTWEPTSAVAA